MILSEKLTAIEKKLNLPGNVSNDIYNFLKKLRKEDIISVALLSIKAKVRPDIAENVLKHLVNDGFLSYFIIIACTNPGSEYFNESEHYIQFNSLKEFNEFSKGKTCPLCECGYEYDYSHAKIGFKLNTNELDNNVK